jgi:uroporphyrinogen-III synthase
MRLLYVHGQDIAFPLSRILKEKGTETDDYIIYRAVPCPEMPQYIREAIKNKSITDVLFFSARAGENFVSISRRSGLEKYICEINALCISVRVLKSVGALQWAGRYVADSPDRKGMISLLNTAT